MTKAQEVRECVTELKKSVPRTDESTKEYINRLEEICKVYGDGSNGVKFPATAADLNTRVVVYVPDTTGIHKRISSKEHAKRAKEVESKFRRDFGGSTTVRGLGTWKSTECPKGICIDNIMLVESFMSEDDWKKHSGDIQTYLTKKKRDWGQASLSVEFEKLGKESEKSGLHFL